MQAVENESTSLPLNCIRFFIKSKGCTTSVAAILHHEIWRNVYTAIMEIEIVRKYMVFSRLVE